MSLYARTPLRRWGQVAADLGVVGWIVLWAWIARSAWSAIVALAEPARRTASAALRIQDDFRAAAERTGRIPVAGSELRRPFESAGASLDQVVQASQEQVRTLENLAVLAAALLFVLPVALVLVFWLPRRVRFAQRSAAVRRLIDGGCDLDLFALRAIATQPEVALARVSADPVGDWRSGRRPAIVALAELELGDLGLALPRAVRAEAADPEASSPPG